MTPPPDSREYLFDLTTRLIDPGPRELDRGPAALWTFAIYGRTMRLFRAVGAVLRQDLAEEAMIVARSLFTESLWLMELAEAEERTRRAKVLWWAERGLREYVEMLRRAERRGTTTVDGGEGTIKQAELRRRAVLRTLEDLALQDLGLRKVRHFGTEKVLAARFGLVDELQTFMVGHHYTHGSLIAHWLSVHPTEQGIDISGQSDPRLLEITIRFAAGAALRARRAVGQIFGWPEPPELGPLLESIAPARKPAGGK